MNNVDESVLESKEILGFDVTVGDLLHSRKGPLGELIKLIKDIWIGSPADTDRELYIRCGTVYVYSNGEIKLALHFPLDKALVASIKTKTPENIFQKLWSRDVGTEGYNKELWLKLEKVVNAGIKFLEKE